MLIVALISTVLLLIWMGFFMMGSRDWFVSRMDTLRGTMTADDRVAIRKFRQLHVGRMLLNVVLLGAFAFGMTRVTL